MQVYVAHLLAQLDSMSPWWQLCDNQVMRNKVKLVIDGAFLATLISHPYMCIESTTSHSYLQQVQE